MMARMNRRRSVVGLPLALAALAPIVLLLGCQGSTPPRNTTPTAVSNAAVLLRAKLSLPSGEIRSGYIDIDIESDANDYRLRALPGTTLYVIEPGAYHFSPARGLFGSVKNELVINFNGRSKPITFPLSLLRHDSFDVKPHHIVSIGILEARLENVSGSLEPEVSFRLVDDPTTRKSLVEDMIHKMMDKNLDPDTRDTAVVWSRALEESLVELQEVQDASPSYKPGPR